ncbi:MAG: CoA transferase [Rickettsiales bacterium]|nr:CoA transferase [Rickettsiales bacterium]OUV78967.1 MAG: hypothetical protein CBC91_04445 [Rickettsiales bacterium TMED131]
MKPLSKIKVLDFTTLLPGPLATLMLCEAGAEIIKVEKIGGEEMRKAKPLIGNESILFAMLNRGKKSIEINLKNKDSLKKIKTLIKGCDVLVEQFRPGVMDKLGLGWKTVKKLNSKLVYCSITGYGQNGEKYKKAGHDINYLAESGLLRLSTAKDGSPIVPITQIADIAGGTYPAFMNILLALFKSQRQGLGSYIDVSMYENLIPLAWLGLSQNINGSFNSKSRLHLNGGLARYNIYKTKDKKFIALGALENKFWLKFCQIIKAPQEVISEKGSQKSLINKVQKIIEEKNENFWKKKFDKENDVCCTVINDLNDFMKDSHIKNKKLFENNVIINKKKLSSIPTVLDKSLIKAKITSKAPKLGQNNNLIKK